MCLGFSISLFVLSALFINRSILMNYLCFFPFKNIFCALIVVVHVGAFEVWHLVQKAGYKADCRLYTTLISTCAKSGKVDTMFEVRLVRFQK